MYIPPHFREDRLEVLHDLIRQNSLATLVTLGEGGLIANHVPLIVDPHPAPYGTLRGHLSRANVQWSESVPGKLALAIFQGPSTYITPSWYPSKSETGRVVPTYNYVAVHAHGELRTYDDPALLEQHLRKLTAAHEAPFTEKWTLDDAPANYIEGLLKAIVGIEIPISKLEGKWKVSQNRPQKDRAGVTAGLRSTSDPVCEHMAKLIEGSEGH